jgi:hypothetical protein
MTNKDRRKIREALAQKWKGNSRQLYAQMLKGLTRVVPKKSWSIIRKCDLGCEIRADELTNLAVGNLHTNLHCLFSMDDMVREGLPKKLLQYVKARLPKTKLRPGLSAGWLKSSPCIRYKNGKMEIATVEYIYGQWSNACRISCLYPPPKFPKPFKAS